MPTVAVLLELAGAEAADEVDAGADAGADVEAGADEAGADEVVDDDVLLVTADEHADSAASASARTAIAAMRSRGRRVRRPGLASEEVHQDCHAAARRRRMKIFLPILGSPTSELSLTFAEDHQLCDGLFVVQLETAR
jgi:hypothetical protein